MKNFEAFLKESYVGKDGNIYASKSEAEKTIAKINKLSDSERVTKGLQGADPSKQLKGQSSDIKTRRENIVNNKKRKISKKLSKGKKSWVGCVAKARKELGVKGFVAIKKGTPLYKRAKELYEGK